MTTGVRIVAVGSHVPSAVLSNADLERRLDTSDAWIVQRTGIRERRIAGEREFTSDLCYAAIENMMSRYAVSVSDTDLILVATYTPDYQTPSVACLIQRRFAIAAAGAMDINAACTGFVYALHVAHGLIAAGMHRKILVLGADTASKIVDYDDRGSCILFGDGAGAVLLEAAAGENALLAHRFGTDGRGAPHLYRSGLSSTMEGQPLTGEGLFRQNGREVYRFVVNQVPSVVQALLQQLGWTQDRIDWFVPHSSNLRMIESLCDKTGIGMDRTIHSLEYYGNTSAATIPLSLDMGVRDGRIRPGDRVLLCGFGGGFTCGAMLLNWNLAPPEARNVQHCSGFLQHSRGDFRYNQGEVDTWRA
ncbi:ketoacyl-ACP synthase III [Paenibacillus cymbidii]|uniref:ketoacyl-ACP synthase III n=1 Tax=Paenibacillus cymbidii TaxID=1639034 RepID=UPI0010810B3F|nr:ketoacyl-ACP synthase III [Paenibacillus cymbidii]